ncbi:hypothetical protein MMC20_001821 [Loxospora ochrophaea]|nr:hypothetical protein [Loxospora ochrophaea]
MERNDNHKGTTNKYDAVQWAANRRWNVMGDLTSRICRLAAITNAAVLVTTQTLTKIREDLGAVLHPAISGKAWDSGVNSRIVLFRDWLPHSSNETGAVESVRDARFAGVIKAGCIHHGGLGKVVPFSIGQHGLREIRTTPRTSAANGLPIATRPPLKRKRDEIVDSQSEDDEAGPDDEFGWEGDINAPFYEDSLGDPDGV